MKVFTDQTGRTIELPVWPPRRIVSVVPSQSELLAYLGLEEEVVGITKFCIHPREWFKSKTRIGGTKKINIEQVRALQPDLIIGNKEENRKEQILELAEEFPVWLSEIYTLEHALDMIRQVGKLTDKVEKATGLAKTLSDSFCQLARPNRRPTVAYLIWDRPRMVVARHTFIDDMLSLLGLENAFPEQERYPEVSDLQLVAAQPDLVFLSSEPYPYKEKHIAAYRKLCPQATIKLVDGELFAWYGSRLLRTADYFHQLRQELPGELWKT